MLFADTHGGRGSDSDGYRRSLGRIGGDWTLTRRKKKGVRRWSKPTLPSSFGPPRPAVTGLRQFLPSAIQDLLRGTLKSSRACQERSLFLNSRHPSEFAQCKSSVSLHLPVQQSKCPSCHLRPALPDRPGGARLGFVCRTARRGTWHHRDCLGSDLKLCPDLVDCKPMPAFERELSTVF